MSGCSIFEGLIDEQLNHKPQYKDEYYEMDDDEQDYLSDEDTRSMMVDPAGEDQWDESMHVKKGDHLKNCKDPGCVEICNTWRSESSLSKYV